MSAQSQIWRRTIRTRT